jgi:molybdenum cofactor cytidylyltransferase
MAGAGLIILAAGASTRLGRPKQLVPFAGRSLLRHGAATALASVCRPVAVVLGAQADRLETELTGLSVTIVKNSKWETGISSSIHAGLAAMTLRGGDGGAGDVNSIVIMLCDQPLVSSGLLDRLVEVQGLTGRGIVAAEYGGTVGVPALFGRQYFAELAALTGDRGAKGIMARHAADVERVPFPQGSLDIDTEEDCQRLRAEGNSAD